MGKGDRRHSNKALQRKAQRKKKDRLARHLAAAKPRSAGKAAAEKKPRARKAAAAPAAG
ncbi:MAG: hypothetical protein WCJ30_00075 [Deltaproteobacteria bacterium]